MCLKRKKLYEQQVDTLANNTLRIQVRGNRKYFLLLLKTAESMGMGLIEIIIAIRGHSLLSQSSLRIKSLLWKEPRRQLRLLRQCVRYVLTNYCNAVKEKELEELS